MRFKNLIITLLIIISCILPQVVAAQALLLQASFPYKLGDSPHEVVSGREAQLYIALEKIAQPAAIQTIQISIPPGVSVTRATGWQQQVIGNQTVLSKQLSMDQGYRGWFDLLSLRTTGLLPAGEQAIQLTVSSNGQQTNSQRLVFTHILADTTDTAEHTDISKNKSWYINRVLLPVDSQGARDERTANNVIYIKDSSVESLKSKMLGEGTTNWAHFYQQASCYLLLDIANPYFENKTLTFNAKLHDRKTGLSVEGLAVNSDEDGAMQENLYLALDGRKSQVFIIPIYVDAAKVLGGEYNLSFSVSDTKDTQLQDIPVSISKERFSAYYTLALAAVCLCTLLFNLYRLRGVILSLGGKSAITIALFAAVAFGGIVVPTTIFGDVLHVLLGPFSGLVSGLLSEVLLYLLVMALLVICPQPGVVTILLLLKWILAALLFGRVSPIGFTLVAVNIVLLETAVYLSGFYRTVRLHLPSMLLVAVSVSLADALATYTNLELMMFFYRLYYADWYLALFVVVNGFIYTLLGSLLGMRVGAKLRQVTGE